MYAIGTEKIFQQLALSEQHTLPPHQGFRGQDEKKCSRSRECMYAPSPPTPSPAILVWLKAPDPSIMGINFQMSQQALASRDKIVALDKDDGGNGGEASCEKGASNSAG